MNVLLEWNLFVCNGLAIFRTVIHLELRHVANRVLVELFLHYGIRALPFPNGLGGHFIIN